MTPELIQEFDRELSRITVTLDMEKEKLKGLDDGEACAVQRQRIMAIETLLAEVKEAKTNVILAELRSQESVTKFIRWREAVSRLREAREAVERFDRPIDETQAQIDAAENGFQVAQAALADHRQHAIENPDYVSEAVIKKWQTRCNELENALKERAAELRGLKGKISRMRSDWLRASDHFSACALTERVLRPRTPEKPNSGMGTLSAIA